MRLFLLLLCCYNLTLYAADSDGVWVNGTGEAEVAPDIATLSFTVSTIDKSASKSQQMNAKIAESVVSKLKSHNVAGKDIQTAGFHVGPEYDYKNRRRELKGHRVQHTYQTIIRKTQKLGDILDSLSAVGDDSLSIGNISFGLSDDGELRLKTLALAVDNAKVKADVLAKAAGKKLGAVLAVEEVSARSAVPMVRMEMMKSAAAAPSTNIETGEVGVSSKVRVHFELN